MELIDKNDLLKRMSIGAPMNWTDSERELGEESQFRDDMLTIQCCQEVPTIPIPTRATNGDMIKAMFPSNEIEIKKGIVWVHRFGGNRGWQRFLEDWWNAPYKVESEVE